jgi:hypothetical protein
MSDTELEAVEACLEAEAECREVKAENARLRAALRKLLDSDAESWEQADEEGEAALASSTVQASAPPRDETVPPPGWRESDVNDPGVVLRTNKCSTEKAWRLYDAEHGYAPQASAPGRVPLPDGWLPTSDGARHDGGGQIWLDDDCVRFRVAGDRMWTTWPAAVLRALLRAPSPERDIRGEIADWMLGDDSEIPWRGDADFADMVVWLAERIRTFSVQPVTPSEPVPPKPDPYEGWDEYDGPLPTFAPGELAALLCSEDAAPEPPQASPLLRRLMTDTTTPEDDAMLDKFGEGLALPATHPEDFEKS